MRKTVDILMVTYNSADYVTLSLPRLLDSCDDDARVWLWHNGDDEATLAAVQPFIGDPRVHKFHHSRENQKLRAPTNWLWSNSDADFVSKVDDDCLVAPDWLALLRAPYLDCPDLGAIGSWRFFDEDYEPELAERKIERLPGGQQLLRNHWVQGSGYLVPRELTQRQGLLAEGQSWPAYCIALARNGARNGWYFPFVREDHMDDPRSPHTLFKTDEDFLRRMPLSAQATGASSLAGWTSQMRESAHAVQAASLDLSTYSGWRAKKRAVVRRAQRLVRGRSSW